MPEPKRSSASRAKPPQPYFNSIAVVVSDRRKAQAWYTEKLGLDLIDSEDHWVTVGRKGRGGLLHLCQVTEYDPKGVLEPGNSGIMLRLPGPDFEASCHALKGQGVEFSHEPEKADWGWWAVVRDPDGNELTLGPET